ncbi:hypothetical protein TNCV_3826861 [Trichonephila clavipes]|nr:hypothetical protein TNCV_3826861 [Trichonephila clavipes]
MGVPTPPRTLEVRRLVVKAYTQVPVNEEVIAVLGMSTPFGLFEFPFTSFGLRNAGQTFQRFIDCTA